MAGNKLNRYLWLINTIRTLGPISYDQINECWLRSNLNEFGDGLPKKTFRNHLEAIQEIFNLEIVCERIGGYKYSIREDEQQDHWMSAFLNTLSIQTAIEEDPHMKDRIINYDVKYNLLLPLGEARNDPSMRGCDDINYTYCHYCPLGMLQVAEHWYIVGIFSDKSKYAGCIGTFRFDDMSEVCEMVGETVANYPENFSLKKYIEEFDPNRLENYFHQDFLLYSDLVMQGIKTL